MKLTFRSIQMAIGLAVLAPSSALLADDAAATSKASKEPKFVVGPELTKVPLEEIERAYEGKTAPEAVRMYLTIARGGRMGPGEGWFGPPQARYSWKWLAEQHGIAPDGDITADKFHGTAAWFKRLDRNLDGRITGDDLDWSDRNSWVQYSGLVNRLFRKADANGNGDLTREEWMAFFDAVAQEKSSLSSDDLRDNWLAGMTSMFMPGDAPTKEMLMQGLFKGEVGSLQEGPQLNEPAPDFTLQTQDGEQTIQLSKLIGKKPIVLMFGNFTCGPFRAISPGVDKVSQRFKDEAIFLGVYVREAHPTDGWKMDSNARVGVAVAQPTTTAERTAVAQRCYKLLQPSFPFLVDTIDDKVGNAYSGMPARLYVIDTAGKVAYKGARGPFGFKPGEMEQALTMTLMDAKPAKEAASAKP